MKIKNLLRSTNFSSFSLLTSIGAILTLTQCAQIFQPSGICHKPDTDGIEYDLKKHVTKLAADIGERNHYYQKSYDQATSYIADEFKKLGYNVDYQKYTISDKKEYLDAVGKTAVNLEVRKPGTNPNAPWLIVGAHYDTRVGMPTWNCHGPVLPSKTGTPGANDNGSGVATVLTLAKLLKDIPTQNGIIFVCYANEEAPFYQTDDMGSRQHARKIINELGVDNIMGMMTPETLGVYSPRSNKKRRSAVAGSLLGVADRCDYIAFMSTNTGRKYTQKCAEIFSKNCRMQVRTICFPYLTKGVAWSDDWSYMKEGIPSFAITDTAYMRCDDYHETSDTAEKLDYREFAEVVHGLNCMILTLTGAEMESK